MTSLFPFCVGVLLVVLTRWCVRVISARMSGPAPWDRLPPLNNTEPDCGHWEGEPLDWLAQLGAGALYVGIGTAVIIDLVILAINPQGQYVSDVIRDACRRHPFLIFAAGAACGHLFWTTVVTK